MTPDQAIAFFSSLFGGRHHIPNGMREGPAGVKYSGGAWYVNAYVGHLGASTWDANLLTRFVFLCHDRCVRGSIHPAGQTLRLSISTRDRAENAGEAPIAAGHPTLEEAVATWREDWPVKP